MTNRVFAQWVESFNADMAGQNRRVLLLLDNASSHCYTGELSHVEVYMLPPNTTSHLQPQDAGVIHIIKVKLNQLKAKHIIKKLNEWFANDNESSKENGEHLYDVTFHQAMQWAKEA
ncbi:hypothetical protein Ae201684P_019633 [Aphanomyces euteiches]|nr:hypothetical protein Ae201684P_019633 [Aphanomyces euteiches]KAH9142957.1 hypothetical protein AeRB84_013009 [Aphanomyces euteiches]